jgi:hypothetical protein
MSPRHKRVPTSNGEIPPLVPPAGAPKWTAAEKLRAIREERLAVKLFKSGFGECVLLAHAVKRSARSDFKRRDPSAGAARHCAEVDG